MNRNDSNLEFHLLRISEKERVAAYHKRKKSDLASGRQAALT